MSLKKHVKNNILLFLISFYFSYRVWSAWYVEKPNRILQCFLKLTSSRNIPPLEKKILVTKHVVSLIDCLRLSVHILNPKKKGLIFCYILLWKKRDELRVSVFLAAVLLRIEVLFLLSSYAWNSSLFLRA